MRLPLPNYCSLDMLDKVIEERQNGINNKYFNGLAAEWKTRIEVYIESGGSPQFVSTWPAIEASKNKFLNLYDSPGKGSAQLTMLRQLRDDHELSICPACGELGEPNTLDHYLPKTKYPHFSITPANLFPMCDACQTSKASKVGSAAQIRYFLHPYFDLFTKFQILKLTIIPPFDKPSFSLTPHPIWIGWRKKLIVSHMRELEIQRRYVKFFRNEYKRLLRLVGIMRQKNQDALGMLKSKSETLEQPTKNSWEYIFYNSVVENKALTDYLTKEELPAYP